MRITHACSVLATRGLVDTPRNVPRAGDAVRTRPAQLHGLFGGGAKEDVAAGLADDELEVELTRPLGVTVKGASNCSCARAGCRAGGWSAAAGVAPGRRRRGHRRGGVYPPASAGARGAGLDRTRA